MRLCFYGQSHAAQHLAAAALHCGFELCEDYPHVAFVSEDTPTDAKGVRDLAPIRALMDQALLTHGEEGPAARTAQVPPGSARPHGPRGDHQAETLRMRDAAHRARYPEQMIVGCADPEGALPAAYETYLRAFGCPVLQMSYESAEFSKMAINAFLISQVETTNMLSRLAGKCGADWIAVRECLMMDARIGRNAYLTPGRWQDSIHLKRDYATLCELDGDCYPDTFLEALDL